MTGAPHSTGERASETEPLVAPRGILELDEYSDSVLPYQNSSAQDASGINSKWLKSSRFRTDHFLLLIQLVFGTFLATCPIPRWSLTYPLRIILITAVAALVTYATPRRVVLSNRERIRRVVWAYLGFSLSMYAVFGASHEVHIDTRWQSWLWYPVYNGIQLGYLTRLVMIVLGYNVQKSAGLHSRNRILGSYFLSLVWVYADFPTTIFDHARGRTHW